MKKEILKEPEIFNDPDFTFNEQYHTYRYKGTKYRSVTNVIKDFTKPFDSEYWSRKKAIDRINETSDDLSNDNINKITSEIVAEWDAKR